MQRLSSAAASILASAYELWSQQVQDDAQSVQVWIGSEPDLLTFLREQHSWSMASEYAPHYLDDLRKALHSSASNGTRQNDQTRRSDVTFQSCV
jgi:hypothetical protein